jgi:hypothetical protein
MAVAAPTGSDLHRQWNFSWMQKKNICESAGVAQVDQAAD